MNAIGTLYFVVIFKFLLTNGYNLYGLRGRSGQSVKFVKQPTILFSFGDPDGGGRSKLLRTWQRFSRSMDTMIYPNDSDISGLTFASPVEWAPWMETIWFGNFYEYRSAYFHDVMYSNNKPKREGALLFRESTKTIQMALLYQRYKRFDENSYSLSNATFFNLFGAETLRLGRYKLPQTDQVILCVTDPLTTSDMKRYFNFFNALKWFRAKFMQQKRKRQYLLNVPTIPQNDERNTEEANFFTEAVRKIEFGHAIERLGGDKAKLAYTIPILPCNLSTSYIVFSNFENGSFGENIINLQEPPTRITSGVSGLKIPVKVLNSQYLMESFFQNLLEFCATNHTIPGIVNKHGTGATHNTHIYKYDGAGVAHMNTSTDLRHRIREVELHIEDGLLSGLFSDLLLRVCTANNVSAVRVVRYLNQGNCTHSSVSMNLQRGEQEYKNTGSLGRKTTVPRILQLLVSYPAGGQDITGDVAITATYNTDRVESFSSSSSSLLSGDDWERVLCKMRSCTSVNITPARILTVSASPGSFWLKVKD